MTEPTAQPVEVHVAGKDQPEAARLLLDAAKDLGYPADVVATIGGGFLVPRDVAAKAGALAEEDSEDDGEDDGDGMETVTASETEAAAHPEVTNPGSSDIRDAGDAVVHGDGSGTALLADQAGTVETADGVQHTGEIPADAELKGEALDQALRDRGLTLSGTADEKRARVAQYDAEHAGDSRR